MKDQPGMQPGSLATAALSVLRARIQGTVLTGADPEYNEARLAWNLTVDQHPAVIVYAESAEDVVAAVQFAREAGLGLAVQATGHGVVRPANDCLLLNTSRLQMLQINAASQTAWIGAGLKWGKVLAETQTVGLAPLLGSSPDVGAVGYTLGGGMGWLARKYGLAADSVCAFEVVTADGQIRRASPSENSDLFWGMRGGGGSLAIVTAMEVQLYPVTTVYGGNLFYPASQAKEVFTRYREWIATLPEDMTASISLMNFPPLPVIPEFLRGQSFAIVRGCYAGPIEQGEALLASWRAWQAPLIDDFKAMPFSQVATISNDPLDPVPGHSTGAWLSELSDGAIDVLTHYAYGVEGPSPITVTESRLAGGAIARVDPEANAYSHRQAQFVLQAIGMAPTPEASQRLIQYFAQFKRDLQPYMTGVYLNFLEGEEAQQQVKNGYSAAAYQRLAAIKAQYDPDNLLGYSFNISPGR